MQLYELRQVVIRSAKDKEFVPTRSFLSEVGDRLPEIPVKDHLRDWWSAMTLAYLRGEETPSTKTRDANQLFLLAAKPLLPDADDLNLDF